jgi:hypothetical protein
MDISTFHARLQNADPSELFAKLRDVELVATLTDDPESEKLVCWAFWY